jgi:hypothetical protein
MEAFEVHTNARKISDNILVINITRGDLFQGPLPSPFIISSAFIIKSTDASKIGMSPIAADASKRLSEDTRRNGGMGQASVVFRCSPRTNDPSARVVCMFERYPFYERPLGAESGYRHLGIWEGVLKGVANGNITLSDISHMVEFPLSDAESVEELDSQFESMDI